MLCLSLSAWAQQDVVMKFKLKSYHQTDTVTLSWGANNKSMNPIIAKLTPSNDEEITIPLNEPRLICINILNHKGNIEVVAQPGETIVLSGRVRSTESKTIEDRIKVEGAGLNDTYTQAVTQYANFIDSIDRNVRKEYDDVFEIFARSKAYNNEQIIADMYNTQHGRQYVDRIVSTFKEKNEMLNGIIKRHSQTFMGPLLMLRLSGRLDKSYQDLYNSLSKEAQQSYYGREVKEEVYPPTLLGDKAPTVSVKNKEGETEILSFTNRGKRYILLDFWASWCEPCRKEIPTLKRLYDNYHDKGLEIISISSDQNADDWKQALGELQTPWLNFIDFNRQSISEYRVEYIPSIFVVDRRGYIIGEKLRGAALEEFIEKLFQR